MKGRSFLLLAVAAGAGAASAGAQTAPSRAPQILAHKIAAKQAAGLDFNGTLSRLCTVPDNMMPRPLAAASIPPRSTWYAEPYKVFDNLYWVGTKVHSAWALKTEDGIIVIDTLYAYAAEEEIIGGLTKLGLDPASIKYVIVTHAHGDHDEGARMLQDRYGARVVMSAADWDLIAAQTSMPGGVPRRDIVARDGDAVTLGTTTVQMVLTPGHTLGTLSMIFPVRDKGRTLTVAYSGGTAFNFPAEPARFDTYIASQKKLAKAAADAGASVLMSNHTQFDNAYHYARIAQLTRPAGEPHPYEVGAAAVARYFTVASECAEAAKLEVAAP